MNPMHAWARRSFLCLAAISVFAAAERCGANTVVLPHVLEGAAVFETNADGDRVVSNIGSSGQDGVSIDIGHTMGFKAVFGLFAQGVSYRIPADTGAGLKVKVTGDDVLLIFDQNIECFDDHIEMTSDFSGAGATEQRIEVRREGKLVSRDTYSNGQVVIIIPPVGQDKVSLQDISFVCEKGRNDAATLRLSNQGGVIIQIDGTEMIGDEITCIRNTGVVLSTLNTFTMLGTNPPTAGLSQIAIHDEACQVFDTLITALGQATFDPHEGTSGLPELTINNIGSSGNDGVSIDLGLADSCAISLSSPDAATATDGTYIEGGATGILDGVPNTPLGSARFTQTGIAPQTSYPITSDFSSVGATTHHLQVFLAGVLVGDFPGRDTSDGSTNQWPLLMGAAAGQTPGIACTFPPATTILVDGALYQCDAIQILAESPPSSLLKTNFALLLSGTGPLTCTNVFDDRRYILKGGLPLRLGDADFREELNGDVSITNIGSSGQDGVSFDLTGTQGFAMEYAPGFGFHLPDDAGGTLEHTLRYRTDHGIPHVTIVKMTQEVFTDHLEMSCDYSELGALTQTIVIKSGGVVTFKGEFPNGEKVSRAPTGPIPPAGIAIDEAGTSKPKKKKPAAIPSAGNPMTLTFTPSNNLVFIVGGQPVQGDEISFEIDPALIVDPLDSVDITATNPGGTSLSEIPIRSMSFAVTDYFQRGVGRGIVSPMGGTKDRIFNLGSTGEDGVVFEFVEAESCAVTLEPIDPGGVAPEGAYIEAELTGTVDHVSDVSVGRVRYTMFLPSGTPVRCTVSVSLSGLQSPTHLIQVFDGATMVAEFPGECCSDGSTNQWPIRFGGLGGVVNGLGDKLNGLACAFPPGTVYTHNGIQYPCTRLLFLSEGPDVQVQAKNIGLYVARIPQIVVADAQATLLYDHHGLPHKFLGEATFTDETERRLPVRNIGSSGQDGVEVNLGLTAAYRMDFDTDFSLRIPDDAGVMLTSVARGVVSPAAPTVTQITATVRQSVFTDHMELEPDFSSVGASTLTIRVLSEDQTTFEGVFNNGQIVSIVPIVPIPDGVAINERWWCHCRPSTGTKTHFRPAGGVQSLPGYENIETISFVNDGTWAFSINGVLYPGDTISFESGAGTEIYHALSGYQLRALRNGGSSFAQLPIADESITVFSDAASSLGQAMMTGETGSDGQPRLVVSNIGSSGNDGVAFDLEGRDAASISWEPIDLASAPGGASIKLDIEEQVAYRDVTLTWLKRDGSDDRASIIPHYNPVCAPCVANYRVAVWNGGVTVFVGDLDEDGLVIDATAFPLKAEAHARFDGFDKLFGAGGTHPPGTIFGVNGVDYVGDRIEILALDLGQTGLRTKGNITFSDVTVVKIQDQSSVDLKRRVFGDFDDSGCTDLNDFLYLLDNWQIEVDGTVIGLDDFLSLLDNWQLGSAC